ncbi:MAG: glutaredoxin [Candidatus Marinamargulisbacteria bacterium]|jgi:glutaredoxin
MIIKLVRNGLGHLIVLGNAVFRPKQISRSEAEQRAVDLETQKLTLYQFHLCPFCVRVRRMIDRLNLSIDYRDAKADPVHHDALLAGGGKVKVPCLRIEEDQKVTWLYESLAINDYLFSRFGQPVLIPH